MSETAGGYPIVRRHLSGGHNDYEITPEGVLVHWISAKNTQPDDPYDPDEIIGILEAYGLAYHDLICRDGTIIELVPAPLRAWHAGESRWRGRSDCNSWMLGEALAGMADDDYTDAQYDALAARTAQRVKQYPIRMDYLAGHDEVAGDDVRGEGNGKPDPGPLFSWERYLESVRALWPPK